MALFLLSETGSDVFIDWANKSDNDIFLYVPRPR